MDASRTSTATQRERAYAGVIADARLRPFEWGLHDCVTFAAAAVRARTGRDVLDDLGIFPAWRTALEAASAIEAAGGLRAALTRVFGEPLPALLGCMGDVALVRDRETDRELLGVVHAEMVLCPALDGLAAMPLTAALNVWRVR